MTVPRPQRRGHGPGALAALLSSQRFRLGRDAARVAANLAAHGGTVDDRATSFVGNDLPPLGALSVTLGAARGTLGPHSFGFLDNIRGIAPLAAPLPLRPPAGSIALLCGRREALPDVGPLCAARGLGVSWIISVGDGDPADVLAFLGADAETSAVLLAAPSLRAPALGALSGKPAVVLGGDPLVRAAVRRAGGTAVDDLEAWFAHGALLAAGAPQPQSPRVAVVGGGAALVEQALRGAGLALAVDPVADDDPEAIGDELARIAHDADFLLVVGSEPVALPRLASVFVEVGQLERVRALAGALVARRQPVEAPAPRLPAERTQARAIVDEAGALLGDHDSKRVLKCYGLAVSRQAPANSATAALRVAATLGFPVEVALEPTTGGSATLPRDLARSTRTVRTTAELRRAAALLLDGGVPYVLVRQSFPAAPRARFGLHRERDFATLALLGGQVDERALLPLARADALLLARAAAPAAGHAVEPLVNLMLRLAACADEHHLEFEVEVHLGDRPVVVAAVARKSR